jgi:hypothetical protein
VYVDFSSSIDEAALMLSAYVSYFIGKNGMESDITSFWKQNIFIFLERIFQYIRLNPVLSLGSGSKSRQ